MICFLIWPKLLESWDSEAPVHEVELSPFLISQYPVTVFQYQRFMEDGGYDNKRYWSEGGFGEYQMPEDWQNQIQFPTRPVVGVSWFEARAYAHWAGDRLPTEAEWERAARGGRAYRKYPWGDKTPSGKMANYYKSKINHPSPVGIFPEDVTNEGVTDMAGNVLEWCEDWYDREKGNRVLRGGSFGGGGSLLRCTYRLWNDPRDRLDFIGFRIARTP